MPLLLSVAGFIKNAKACASYVPATLTPSRRPAKLGAATARGDLPDYKPGRATARRAARQTSNRFSAKAANAA